MKHKLTYLGFQSFDGKLYGYELIGLGLVLNYYVKSKRMVMTNVWTGQIAYDDIKKTDIPIDNFEDFVNFAQFTFIGLLDDSLETLCAPILN